MTDIEQLIEREVDCPRCHETCGWCGDYRHMHGQLSLPGNPRRRCDMPGLEPEGDACPICRGARRVHASTTFRALQAEQETSEDE